MRDGFIRKKVQKVVSKTGIQITIVANGGQKELFSGSPNLQKNHSVLAAKSKYFWVDWYQQDVREPRLR